MWYAIGVSGGSLKSEYKECNVISIIVKGGIIMNSRSEAVGYIISKWLELQKKKRDDIIDFHIYCETENVHLVFNKDGYLVDGWFHFVQFLSDINFELACEIYSEILKSYDNKIGKEV